MKRRDVLRAGAAGLATIAVGGAPSAEGEPASDEGTQTSHEQQPNLAAACGLFCGSCPDLKEGRCHGCGCTCGHCVASSHAAHCKIVRCVSEQGAGSCADCADFACTDLIMHTHDPVWQSHAPCLDNLRRRKSIGTEAWVTEQQEYWADENNVRKWTLAAQEGMAKAAKLRSELGYTRPY